MRPSRGGSYQCNAGANALPEDCAEPRGWKRVDRRRLRGWQLLFHVAGGARSSRITMRSLHASDLERDGIGRDRGRTFWKPSVARSPLRRSATHGGHARNLGLKRRGHMNHRRPAATESCIHEIRRARQRRTACGEVPCAVAKNEQPASWSAWVDAHQRGDEKSL